MPDEVRVIYIVPSDRNPWLEAQQCATGCLEDLQWFFADEMDRLGYGPKTFEIGRDASGLVVFYQIDSELTTDQFIVTYWNNCKSAATNHALRDLDWVTVYFFEAYLLKNGSTKTQAGSKGWPRGRGGEAFLSSLHLKMAKRDWLSRDDGYAGEIFDWISPTPLESGALSWNGRGPTLGDVSGSGYGMIAHELAHCFGPAPEEKQARCRCGPLMGPGCRGMRGYFRPNLTTDRCLLRKEDAALLNASPFFAVRALHNRPVL